MPTNWFSITPLKVNILAGEQKATELWGLLPCKTTQGINFEEVTLVANCFQKSLKFAGRRLPKLAVGTRPSLEADT